MNVFIVENGEKCEGGSVVSVHKTLEGARKAALEVSPCFEGGWKELEYNYWENGCDYVKVREKEVKK